MMSIKFLWTPLNTNFKEVRFYSLNNEKKKLKFEKNTKFHEQLYKYHFKHYIDNVSTRPDLYIKDAEVSEKNPFDKRLKRNMPFVYSNEVKNIEDLKKNPLTLVNLKNNNNESFGVATFNPYALITARIINYNSLFSINIYFFIEKIKSALLWRSKIVEQEARDVDSKYTPALLMEKENKLMINDECTKKQSKDEMSHNINSEGNFNKNCSYPLLNSRFCYRLVNAEGDNLPGLIIDRYDDYISIQHLTLGCEMLACIINDAVVELLKPKAILFRNDNKERLHEKLELYKKKIYGEVQEKVLLVENNCMFLINLLYSPGTGWFYNRRNVRKYVCQFCVNKNILDVFSYVGSFGIQCSKMGKAKNVVCVEKNEQFLQMAKESAALNNVTNIEFICDDALMFLKKCKTLYDIVILDPPNLIPKSSMLESGSQRYIDLINLAQNCVATNGLLHIIFTSKLCSYQDYINLINKAFKNTNKIVKIVGQGRASPDNPVHLSLYNFSDFYWFLLQVCY